MPGGELPGALGAGVDADLADPAVAQSGHGRPGVGARADDEGAHALGRRQAARSEVQADGHDAASGARQRSCGGDAPRDGRGVLDGASDVAGDGALCGRQDQGAAELPGDLALADDHRLQSGSDCEELAVGGPPRPEAQIDRSAGSRALSEEGAHGVAQALGRPALGGVQEDRQPIAGAQDEDAVESPDGAEQVGAQMRGDAAQAGDCLQALDAMVCRKKMNGHSGR